MDFRISRTAARKLVLEQDAFRRERMPIFRSRPPLDDEAIGAALPYASARNAFWRTQTVSRPIDEALAGATAGQRIAYCVPYSHSDICNGGFHQYFSNSTGDFSSVVIESLASIGDVERANVMRRAMGRFPNGVAPRSRVERQKCLASIDYRSDWRPWVAPIEEAYYALGHDDLDRRVREYVSSHPGEFFLDG